MKKLKAIFADFFRSLTKSSQYMGKKRTDFLFSNAGFLVGAGSVINIFGNYYEFNASESEQEADSKAIRNDFEMVGQDIEQAIKEVQPQK